MQFSTTQITAALILAGLLSMPVFATPETGVEAGLRHSASMWEAKGRTDIARDILEKALSIETDPEVLLQLGSIELRSGNIELAAGYLQRLEQRYPQHPDTRALRSLYRVYTEDKQRLASARLMARAGKNEEAAKIMRQLFPDAPPTGEMGIEYYQIVGSTAQGQRTALADLAKLYQTGGDVRYRLAWLKLRDAHSSKLAYLHDYEALATNPEVNRQELRADWWAAISHLPTLPENEPWVRHYLKEFPDDQKAIDYLADLQQRHEEAVRIARDPAVRARNAGFSLLQQGKMTDAERAFQKALSIHPDDPEALGGIGLLRLRQGNDDEALSWFQRAARMEPGSSKWRSLIHTASFWGEMKRADTLLDAGKLPDAQQAARRALAIEPDNADGLALLGNIYAQDQNPKEAEHLYREALKRDASNTSAMRGLLTLLSRSGRHDEAQALIAEFRRKNPREADRFNVDQAGILRDEADAFIAAHRPSHAMQALETAVLLSPRDAWIRYDLANLYERLGLPILSLRVMSEGDALAPNDPAMNYAYALVLTAHGHEEEALVRLARIPPSARTAAMNELETRAFIKLRIRQSEQLFAEGRTEQADQALYLAERHAADQPNAVEQVAEGWFGLKQPDRGLALMKQHLIDAKTATTSSQLYYASLLNRAKQDDTLSTFLPRLYQRTDWSDEQQNTLLLIESDLAARQIEQLIKRGKSAQARILAARMPASGKAGELATLKAQARLLMAANDTKAALPILRTILQKSSDDLESRLNLAQLYAQQGDKHSAQNEINRLLPLVPENDLDTRLTVVRLEVHLDKLVEARQMMAALLNRYPDNPDVLIQAGRIERSDRQYQAALNYFRQALRGSTLHTEEDVNPTPLLELHQKDHPLSGLTLQLSLTLNATESSHAGTNYPITETAAPILRLSADLMSLPVAPPVRPALPEPVNKIATMPLIGKAEEEIDSIETRRDPRIEMGYEQLDRSSTDGLSAYQDQETPLVAWWPLGYDGHAFLHVDRVNIDAGVLQSADASNFGQIAAKQAKDPQYNPAPVSQIASGTSVAVGYQGDDLRWDMGVIGMGFPVQNVVGGIRRSFTVGNMDYAMELSRRPETGILLSYAGAIDPVTHEAWGGVTNTSVNGRASTTLGQINAFASAQYGLLRGQNVLNNTVLAVNTGVDKDIFRQDNMRVNLGLALTFWNYKQNEGYYTFGQGGYYSPQSYTSLSLPLEWTGREGKLSYRAQTSVSYSQTSTSNALYYPTDSVLQRISGNQIYAGGSGSGNGYILQLATEYRLTPHLAIGGNVDVERSSYYAPNYMFVYLRYLFQPHLEPVAFPPVPVKPYSSF